MKLWRRVVGERYYHMMLSNHLRDVAEETEREAAQKRQSKSDGTKSRGPKRDQRQQKNIAKLTNKRRRAK